MTMTDEILTGMVLDEHQILSLYELADISACRVEWITELVEEGIIVPDGNEPSEWVFTGISLIRVRTAIRLQRDLNVNLPGIALAMDLLDEIDKLQSRLEILE
jgi:chaperone modulatory protein CbpM